MILAAQSGAFKQENVLAERLHGLDQQMERKGDESLYFMDGGGMNLDDSRWEVGKDFYDEINRKEWISGDDQTQIEMDDLPLWFWQTLQKALETRLDLSTA
ncbi:hypothetical protein Tco_1239613 [Tanacetum coccineum]